jgi:adiponectin receptor
MFYAVFGLSSIFFVIHGLILYGWEVQKGRMSLVWMGRMATANLLGAAIYAARVIMFLIEYGSLLDIITAH